MKVKSTIGIFLISVLFFSCKSEFQEKNIDDQFTIELPSYMVELDLGIPEASLEYGDEMKEHFVAVLRANPSELGAIGITNLETYSEMYMSGLKLSVNDATINRIGDGITENNGMQMISYEADGVLPENGLGIYYHMKFYKSKTAYYYVLNWTSLSFKDDYLSDMKRITNSIKEL